MVVIKSGWLGFSHGEEYLHDRDGRSDFILSLMAQLRELQFSNEFEVHLNRQFLNFSGRKKFLIVLEHPAIRPQNFFIEGSDYDWIFGWDRKLGHLKNFTYLRYPHEPKLVEPGLKRNYRYSMMCTNRNFLIKPRAKNLYDERANVVQFADQNNFDFRLFGLGWDQNQFKAGFTGRLRFELFKHNVLSNKRSVPLKVYYGKALNKFSVLKSSKFNFCYENIGQYDGYVSEKLWDAVFAGCIPVYWPSGDTYKELVNENLIVNASKFSNCAELFEYLESITDYQIETWQNRLLGAAKKIATELSIKKYCDIIINRIILEMNK